jgi:Lysylphosphatidylglycerol synthase TM region
VLESGPVTRARILQLGFFLAALCALLWLLNRIGWSSIGQALAQIGLAGAVVLTALGLLETILDSLAMTIAIRQRLLSRVLFINSVGAILNQFLPFDLGEVAKAGLVHRSFPSGTTIAGTIVWNYVFKISRPIVTVAAALIGLLGATRVELKIRLLVLGGAAISFIPYLVLRMILRHGVAASITRLLRVLRVLRRDPERVLAQALAIDTTVAGFWRERRSIFLATLFIQIAARLTSWAGLLATLRLIGFPIGFNECALLYAAMNTADLIITLIPARLGVSEGAAFGVFKLIGLPPHMGVIMYLVFRIRSVVTTALLAPLGLLRRPAAEDIAPTDTAPPGVAPAAAPPIAPIGP